MAEIKECFKLALRNLKSRRLRSWLTILGIVIGVFLIVSLLSLSEGIKTTITQQLKALGEDVLFVIPGDLSNLFAMFIGGVELEKADLEAIQRTPGVETVLPYLYSSGVMRYEGESKMVLLTGLPLEEGVEILERFQGWSLAEGRWPVWGKREMIVGQEVVKSIFKKKIRVNSEATINGKKVVIVGILNSLGSKSDDSIIYMDLPVYREVTGKRIDSAQMAMVKVKEGVSIEAVAEEIRHNLKETRKRKINSETADFSVITSETMGQVAGNIMSVLQMAVFIFASIAILVGGIGVANTMFTSVRERTREIGVMKAVGAKNSIILTIFLIESGIIGLIGGLGGTTLGLICAKLVEFYGQVHPMFYFKAIISPGLIVFGLFFSFFVGCLAGFFPARKAAKLKPVDALRHYE